MRQVLKPPALRRGATIGVAAVSGPVDEARLEAGLHEALTASDAEPEGDALVSATRPRQRRELVAVGADGEDPAGGEDGLQSKPRRRGRRGGRRRSAVASKVSSD